MQQNKLKHWLHQLNLITPEQPLHFQLFPLRTLQVSKIRKIIFSIPPLLQEHLAQGDATERQKLPQTALDRFQITLASMCGQLYLLPPNPSTVTAKLKRTDRPVSTPSAAAFGTLDHIARCGTRMRWPTQLLPLGQPTGLDLHDGIWDTGIPSCAE